MEFGIDIPSGRAFDAVALGLNAADHLIVVPHYPGFNSKVELLSHTLAAGGQSATALGARALLVSPHYPGINSKVELLSHTRAAGGQCATAMVALARLGMRTRYIGKI